MRKGEERGERGRDRDISNEGLGLDNVIALLRCARIRFKRDGTIIKDASLVGKIARNIKIKLHFGL